MSVLVSSSNNGKLMT